MAGRRSAFGSIFRRRRPDGRPVKASHRGRCFPGYYVRLQLAGKQVWKRAGETKKEAEEFLAAVRREAFEADVLGVRPIHEITFRDFAKEYLAHIERAHSPTTFRTEQLKVENLLVPFFGDAAMSAIAREDVERYLATRRKVSVATRNRDVALLSGMFKHAIALGHTRENPVVGVKRPREPVRPVPFVDLDGQAKLISCCPAPIQSFAQVALDTGCRRGELLALEWSDVDLTRAVVLVRRSKSGHPREVPLTARAADRLAALREERAIPLDGRDRVFSWLPESWPGEFATMFRTAAERALGRPLRFHDLRHLCAVNLTRAGVPLADVAKILGHRTLITTMRYAHHSPTDAAALARDRLETLLRGAPEAPSAKATGTR